MPGDLVEYYDVLKGVDQSEGKNSDYVTYEFLLYLFWSQIQGLMLASGPMLWC